MGRTGDFTDYKAYFESEPTGIFVGVALFALAITFLVVSSILQSIKNRCCPQEKDSSAALESTVDIDKGIRNSFENPTYSHNDEERQLHINAHRDQGIADRNSSAAHLKIRSSSESDNDYVNVQNENIIPPDRNSETKDYDVPPAKSRPQSEDYDVPPPQHRLVKKVPINTDDDETPDYDVPKTFTGNTEAASDLYDVPKHSRADNV